MENIEFKIPLEIKAVIEPKKTGVRTVGFAGHTDITMDEEEPYEIVMNVWPEGDGASRVYVEEKLSAYYDNIVIKLYLGDHFIPDGVPEVIIQKLKDSEEEIGKIVDEFLQENEHEEDTD